ncbi:hypothetical protein DFH11DRAFT_1624142 [Phellopilus nigrolimitatus]|nr:hypothetical protein DFH11DRAFT_1624142 [Phellopilus nigrolimitatus]
MCCCLRTQRSNPSGSVGSTRPQGARRHMRAPRAALVAPAHAAFPSLRFIADPSPDNHVFRTYRPSVHVASFWTRLDASARDAGHLARGPAWHGQHELCAQAHERRPWQVLIQTAQVSRLP